MKMQFKFQILVLAFLAFGLMACEEDENVTQPAKQESNTVEIAQQVFQLFQAKDSTGFYALLAENSSVSIPMNADGSQNPTIFTGKPAVSAYFSNLFVLFETIRFNNLRFTEGADGRTVWAEALGDFVTNPALGSVPYRNVYAIKIEVQNDRIINVVEYVNPVTIALLFGTPLGPQ